MLEHIVRELYIILQAQVPKLRAVLTEGMYSGVGNQLIPIKTYFEEARACKSQWYHSRIRNMTTITQGDVPQQNTPANTPMSDTGIVILKPLDFKEKFLLHNRAQSNSREQGISDKVLQWSNWRYINHHKYQICSCSPCIDFCYYCMIVQDTIVT